MNDELKQWQDETMPADEPETLESLRRLDDALDARIAQLMELKAVIELDIVKMERQSNDAGIIHICGGG